MEGDYIKINEWLRPLSWLYGIGVGFRNHLFDIGLLKSRSFDVPVISVGNITVGGSGKTPCVEYLIRLLEKEMQVAVLSRGYKRKSRGFRLAFNDTPMREIGDEPYQMKQKFKDVYVAVDADRCHGIECLTKNEETKDTDVVLLDDAFQHRYVKPGINILLVDYHRLIIYDTLLPAGRLRENKSGKHRADIVIVTKCPDELKPMDYRVLTKAMDLYPYQQLYFTKIRYKELLCPFTNGKREISSISDKTNILLLTGIASPKQLIADLGQHTSKITSLSFPDHHQFKAKDVERINTAFESLPKESVIITTEKDFARLQSIEGLTDEVKKSMFVLPIEIEFLLDKQETFNEKILGYVRKNSRNSILAKSKDDHCAPNRNNLRDGSRTISFRNN